MYQISVRLNLLSVLELSDLPADEAAWFGNGLVKVQRLKGTEAGVLLCGECGGNYLTDIPAGADVTVPAFSESSTSCG